MISWFVGKQAARGKQLSDEIDETSSSDHHCPSCGVPQKLFERYPWYICNKCLKLAKDRQGRPLVFFNVSLSGGLGWSYADTPELAMTEEVTSILCFIGNRQVIVTEARFGGVVAQPCGAVLPREGDFGFKNFVNLSGEDRIGEPFMKPIKIR